MWETLNEQLYSLIDGQKTALGLQVVSNFPKLTGLGYPALSIWESDVPSDYETTTENQRVYAFRVRIMEEVRDGGLEAAFSTLRPVVDSLMDELDAEAIRPGDTRTIGVDLPSDKIYIDMEATPGFWGQIESEGLIFTELSVKIKISVDLI